MWRAGLTLILASLAWGTALAQAPPVAAVTGAAPDLVTRLECPLPREQLDLRPEEEGSWGLCERFAWSCVRQGLEANFYAMACLEPRSAASREWRKPHEYTALLSPLLLKDKANLGPRFLRTILSTEEYAKQITPIGVRIFGAYFPEQVDLENVRTDFNVVVDGSVLMKGARLTNFKTENNVSFEQSNFRNKLYLLRVRIGGSVFMSGSVFEEVDFRDARIEASIEAQDSIFTEIVRMDRARIDGKVNFTSARLTTLTAVSAQVGGRFILSLADIRGFVDLTGITIDGDLRLIQTTFGWRQRLFGETCLWREEKVSSYERGESNLKFTSPDDHDALVAEVYGGWSKLPTGQIDPTLRRVPKTGVCHERYDPAAHFVRLSNTRVNGALCLIDLTGTMRSSGVPGNGYERHAERVDIREITLDGVEANTLVFRWPSWSDRDLRTNEKAHVDTLWRAVNVKTRHLVIDMVGGPPSYFVDEIDFETISLISSSASSVDKIFEADQDDTKACSLWLSEDASRRSIDDVIGNPANLARIIDAFRYNEAESAQPFSRFVARLEQSAAASTELRIALRDFRRDKLCRTSKYFKDRAAEKKYLEVASTVSTGAEASSASPLSRAEALAVSRDLVCFAFLGAYKHFVGYGYEPERILIWIAALAGFFWLLLSIDPYAPIHVADHSGGRRDYATLPPKLGLFYSIDMLLPLMVLRREHHSWLPGHPFIRAYYFLHRVLGAIISLYLIASASGLAP